MENKTALITGASRGIGKGISIALAQKGFDIIAIARNIERLNLFKEELESTYSIRCFPFSLDISDLQAQYEWVTQILPQLPKIDLLVNNAGIPPEKRMDILECTPESFDKVMGTNLRGQLFFTQQIAKNMIANKTEKLDSATYFPRIVFITSISAETASPSRVEYCISKAGLSMVAKTFAVRLAEWNIPVFEIRPGIILTDMTASVKSKYDDLIQKGLLLQKRWGTPEDVANCVVAIAEGLFDYATGSIFEISGGFSILRL